MIGRILQDRYRLDTELGRGGMGVVYRGQDNLLARPVAVKVLSNSDLGGRQQTRLLNEAQAVARLNHGNIVTVFDAGRDPADDLPFIVMELVEGKSLRYVRPDSLSVTLDLFGQICQALTHAHEHGIVHRDLKPENILVNQNNKVKLMDFGLARIGDGQRLTGKDGLVGTFNYISPELLKGEEASPQSDLYALGVMFYEMVTGRLPFVGDNLVAILGQHLHAPVVPPSTHQADIPPALDILILQLMRKEPADRPSSAAAVTQSLTRLTRSWSQSINLSSSSERVLATLNRPLNRLATGRMVGREQDFSQAQSAWQQATAGQGRIVLLSGEPGIGKSRLTREIMTMVELTRGTVLSGAGYAEGGAPYAPLGQIIRTILSEPPPTETVSEQHQEDTGIWSLPQPVLAALLAVTPDLAYHFPQIPANPTLSPQAEQQRLFESIVTAVRHLAKRQPLLLVFEDAQWIDSATLSLVRHLSRRLNSLAVMLLITFRESELSDRHLLPQLELEWSRQRLAEHIKLQRLNRAQTQEMLETLFTEKITDEFRDGIYRETEGNPFFIEEVCKSLIESGIMAHQAGHWQRPAMAEMAIPHNIRLAVQARVEQLPEQVRTLLQQAALFGREFDYAALRSVSDLDEEALIDALETAEQAQLIAEAQPARLTSGSTGEQLTFSFTHALFPATLQDSLSSLRRRRLHRRAGEALEKLYPDRRQALADQLARHFTEAAIPEKATTYQLMAADEARRVYAYDEAASHYQAALPYLRQGSDQRQAGRTLMILGQIYHSLFNFSQARQAYQEGFSLWQQASDRQPAATLPPADRPLRIAWTNPIALDPMLTNDVQSGVIINQLFEGLVSLTPQLDIVPGIAQSWEIAEGGRRYRFYLNPAARWSDGTPLTAADFIYAWQRILGPDSAGGISIYLNDLVGVEAFQSGKAGVDALGVRAINDHTLEVTLEEPVGYFLYLLSHMATYPVPRHQIERHGAAWAQAENIVSNGPFMLTEWQPDKLLRMQRNPHYQGPFEGNIEHIEVQLAASARESLEGYLADEQDVNPFSTAQMAQGSQLHEIRQMLPGDYLSVPHLGTYYLGFNLDRPPFDNPLIRRALAQALDQEWLAEVVNQSFLAPATGGFIPPSMLGHIPDLALPYDPDAARAALAEAGYPGGQGFPPVTWLGLSDTEQSNHYMARQWEEVLGLKFTWETIDWPTYLNLLLSDPPDIYIMAWVADYPDPDNFLRLGLHGAFDTPSFQAVLKLAERARRITDQAKRLALYRQAEELLISEVLIVPLLYTRGHLLIKPWVHRFSTSPVVWYHWKDTVLVPPDEG